MSPAATVPEARPRRFGSAVAPAVRAVDIAPASLLHPSVEIKPVTVHQNPSFSIPDPLVRRLAANRLARLVGAPSGLASVQSTRV